MSKDKEETSSEEEGEVSKIESDKLEEAGTLEFIRTTDINNIIYYILTLI